MIQKVEGVLSTLQDAETGQRGFLLTGEERYLELHAADELTRDIAARTLSSGKRTNRLIDDMLDFARARLAGGIPLTRASADLGALVQRAAREHQSAFPDRRIDLQCPGGSHNLLGGWRQAGRHDGRRLGLFIAQQIVHAYDGRIAVDSGNGTHAVFSVPRRPAGRRCVTRHRSQRMARSTCSRNVRLIGNRTPSRS